MKQLVFGMFVGAIALTGVESAAHACGGCFHPSESPTVVTDHRMIFSISSTQSTLYDQINYTGSPSSFGWVLPFAGDITVGVSSDLLFSVLDSQTATAIYAPAPNCPAPPSGCQFAQDGGAFSVNGKGVDVLKREVVGPYDTAQLAASDVDALGNWLAKNGFVLPEEIKPTIAAYQAEHFNFLAVKLVPGQSVQSMRPIRVTTKGANVALPLRMVAAGTGAMVGITLWVVAEGRYEPSNFNSFAIATDELSWDWNANKSNYTDLRAQKTAAGNGRTWEIESALTPQRELITSLIRNGGSSFFPVPVDAGADYPPSANQTSAEEREADIATLYAGIAAGTDHITRMRADLSHAQLDADLLLKAATDQSILSNIRNITKEANEPQCPVYSDCSVVSTAPRSQAGAMTAANNSGDDDGCSSTKGGASSAWLSVALGFVGIALRRKIRRR